MAIDSNHKDFSSAGSVSLDQYVLQGPGDDAVQVGGFIAMDQPEHEMHRKIVSPALAPSNIAKLEHLIRERTQFTLSQLPVGEDFDWVEAVSKSLTLLMLATLLDVPLEHQGKLKRWSDAIAGAPGDGKLES